MQTITLPNFVKDLEITNAIVCGRYSNYKVSVKSVLGNGVKHVRVESLKYDIPNN
ncbi:hypothetical protein [Schnuerera ultunensis]|uniref:Uncharacterized protein n=1 Tax=[Clostridium] ultunense Esp TaxID=1288971 RepID=A0A1M4PLM7_9FIRM|nr:hypothetical protein [Schnuerera ultunensis]SHD76371.1 protein of unknown function [[Clostridium] ultunense Esp]